MEEQTVSEQSVSYAASLEMARRSRAILIDLTHELPEDAPQAALRLWNEADTALLAFIRELEARS